MEGKVVLDGAIKEKKVRPIETIRGDLTREHPRKAFLSGMEELGSAG